MLGAVAEMESDLIVERIQVGLAHARAEGKTLGRPTKTPSEERNAMAQGYMNRRSVSTLGKLCGVSHATDLTIVKPRQAVEAVAKRICRTVRNRSRLCKNASKIAEQKNRPLRTAATRFSQGREGSP